MIRRILSIVALVTASLAVAAVAVELGMRWFRPRPVMSVCVNRWDADVGIVHIGGVKGFVRCSDYEMDIVINSKGLRDREFEYEKTAGTKRILCLGDSYTFGYGVAANESFPKHLEKLLNEKAGSSRWEVLNAGVGNTGTAHQLAYFETEGYRYAADVVVLCFCPANDFYNNISSQLYRIENGELVRRKEPCTGARRIQRIFAHFPWLYSRLAGSHLMTFVRYRISDLHHRKVRERVKEEFDRSTVVELHNDLTERLIFELRDACERRGARFMAVFVPPLPGATEEWTRELITKCEVAGIPCVDLAPFFEERKTSGKRLHFTHDGHWTVDGNALVAEALERFLVEQGIVTSRAMF